MTQFALHFIVHVPVEGAGGFLICESIVMRSEFRFHFVTDKKKWHKNWCAQIAIRIEIGSLQTGQTGSLLNRR